MLPPDANGIRTIFVYHFDAGDSPLSTLNADRALIPKGSHAVVFGGQNNDPVSMGTLQSVMNLLAANQGNIVMDGLYNSAGLWADANGNYYTFANEIRRGIAAGDGTWPTPNP